MHMRNLQRKYHTKIELIMLASEDIKCMVILCENVEEINLSLEENGLMCRPNVEVRMCRPTHSNCIYYIPN